MSRYIDADLYAAEMKTRQDACKEIMDSAKEDEKWELYGNMSAKFDIFIEAKLTLDNMPTVDAVPVKWISVKDRLPKPRFAREWYLVALESGCVKTLAFERDRNEWHETGSPVTHWMELPEPPNCADGERRTDDY